MAENNHSCRMTAFRRANRRRRMVKKLLKAAAAGCGMALLAVGIAFAQLNTESGQGTFDQPVQVEALPVVTEMTKTEPVTETEPEFDYVGELEVAAYCGDEAVCTYSGEPPVEGYTAAGDLSVFKIGDQVCIDGTLYVIEDKVGINASEKLCIYFNSYEEAMDYGRKVLPVYRHSPEQETGEEYLGEFIVTAYCGCPQCCGDKFAWLTKMETVPIAGHTIAVDPSVIPLGTEIVIDGVTYLAEDTGQAIKGYRLDIFFDTHEEASRYGRKEKHVYLKE